MKLYPQILSDIQEWQQDIVFEQTDYRCIETIMLKIIDGKCKMLTEDKLVIHHLYELNKASIEATADPEITASIHQAITPNDQIKDNELSEGLKLKIYEFRLLAETQISRPVMKKFKSRIREAGLYDCLIDIHVR